MELSAVWSRVTGECARFKRTEGGRKRRGSPSNLGEETSMSPHFDLKIEKERGTIIRERGGDRGEEEKD